jgi:hypothetical protein
MSKPSEEDRITRLEEQVARGATMMKHLIAASFTRNSVDFTRLFVSLLEQSGIPIVYPAIAMTPSSKPLPKRIPPKVVLGPADAVHQQASPK